MSQKEETIIPASTFKLLTDKLYEKRKLGALEIEQITKKFIEKDDDNVILLFLSFIFSFFSKSLSLTFLYICVCF